MSTAFPRFEFPFIHRHFRPIPAQRDCRRARADALFGKLVCFAYDPDGPRHEIASVGPDGMIVLRDLGGPFEPHMFVVAEEERG